MQLIADFSREELIKHGKRFGIDFKHPCQDPAQQTHKDLYLSKPHLWAETARKIVLRLDDPAILDIPKGNVMQMLGIPDPNLYKQDPESIKSTLQELERKKLDIKPSELIFGKKTLDDFVEEDNIPVNVCCIEAAGRKRYQEEKEIEDYRNPPFKEEYKLKLSYKCRNPFSDNSNPTLDITFRQQYEYFCTEIIINRPDNEYGKKGVLKYEIFLLYRNTQNPLNLQLVYADEITRTDKVEKNTCDVDITYYLIGKIDDQTGDDLSQFHSRTFTDVGRMRVVQGIKRFDMCIMKGHFRKSPTHNEFSRYIKGDDTALMISESDSIPS